MNAENHLHERFMQRCFDLALRGAGCTAPNPLVGSVVVYKEKIIGEGFHAAYGGPHAEVNAINSVSDSCKTLLPYSTLYVNLEPCCHFGKTPPCTDLIMEKGIKHVVFSNSDPNPVSSGGAALLKTVGCSVTTGILEQQGAWLNRRFFTGVKKKRPYVILKWAQSADGFFTRNAGEQHWITGEHSKRLVHRWRSEESAILCGTNTAVVDNPQLTNRLWTQGKQPLRVVLDRTLRLPRSLRVFDASAPTLVITEQPPSDTRQTHIKFDDALLDNMLQHLYTKGILSVMVEGGATLLHSFISKRLWDEARIFTGNVWFGGGVPAPVLQGKMLARETVGSDVLRVFAAEE